MAINLHKVFDNILISDIIDKINEYYLIGKTPSCKAFDNAIISKELYLEKPEIRHNHASYHWSLKTYRRVWYGEPESEIYAIGKWNQYDMTEIGMEIYRNI